MIHRLRAVLENADVDLSTQELLDVLWLAVKVTGGPERSQPPDAHHDTPPGDDERDTRAQDDPEGQSRERSPDALLDDDDEPGRKEAAPAGLYADAKATQHGGPASPAQPVEIRGVSALTSPRGLSRALRPLRRRVPSRRHFRLDEARSAEWIAETGRPDAVLRPERERWLTVALIVDDGPSMVLWRQLAAEVRAMLERQGAFRQVRVLGLDSSHAGEPVLRARPFTPNVPRRSYGQLLDSADRTVVLVLSDGVGAAWRSGAAQRTLARWARRSPLAVLQPLPPRMWPDQAMPVERLLLRTDRRAAPNRRLSVRHPVLPAGLLPPYEGVPVPVLEIAEEQLGAWARLTADDRGSAELPVMMLPADAAPEPADPVPDSVTPAAPATPEQRLRRFREGASPEGQYLAGRLASVHPLTLPVMSLVHQACRDRTAHFHPAQLAEVFLGGLLRVRPATTDEYEFHPGVADLLLDAVRTDDALDTVERVTAYLRQRQGSGPDFRARMTGLGGHPAVPADARPFAAASPDLMRRLGLSSSDASGAASGNQPGGEAAPSGTGPDPSGASERVRPHVIRAVARIGADRDLPGMVREQVDTVLSAGEAKASPSIWPGFYELAQLAERLVDAGLGERADEFRGVLREQIAGLVGDDALETRNVRGHIALALNHFGDHDDADEHLRQIIAISARVHGPEHEYTLNARRHRADLLHDAGRLGDAEEEQRALIDLHTRLSGADADDTLRQRHDLAQTLRTQDREQEAVAEYRAVYEIRLGCQGPEDPDTVNARWWLAWYLSYVDRNEEAEPEVRGVLESRIRADGPRTRRTLAAHGAWARVLLDLGRYEEAEPELRFLVDTLISLFGPYDADTIQARQNFATLLMHVERYEEAAAETEDLIGVVTRTYGARHDRALWARRTHAVSLTYLERYEEVEAIESALVEEQSRLRGADHPDTLTTRHNLAFTHAEQGRDEEAESQYREVLRLRTESHGPDHKQTLLTRHNRAVVLNSLRRGQEAESEYRAVLEARTRVLGAAAEGTVSTRIALARCLSGQQRFEEAEAEHRLALSACESPLGPDHRLTLRARQALGSLLTKMGRYPEAEVEFTRTLEGRVRTLGEDHRTTLTSRSSRANVLRRLGRLDEAESEYQKVLEGRVRVLGPDHEDVQETRQALHDTRVDRGKAAEGEGSTRPTVE